MFTKCLPVIAAVLLTSALPAEAQQYGLSGPVVVRGGSYSPSRPGGMISRGGFLGTRSTVNYYGSAYGFGNDYYGGYYYRPMPDYGYYYLGDYYPTYSGEVIRTPLSIPAPGLVPIPNITGVSTTSPTYSYPDLINPATNPTIIAPRR